MPVRKAVGRVREGGRGGKRKRERREGMVGAFEECGV